MNFYQYNNNTSISVEYRWNFLVEIDSNLMYWNHSYNEKRRSVHRATDIQDKTIFIGSL